MSPSKTRWLIRYILLIISGSLIGTSLGIFYMVMFREMDHRSAISATGAAVIASVNLAILCLTRNPKGAKDDPQSS